MKRYPEVTFEDVKAGDVVTRMLAGEIPVKLNVQTVTDTVIDCGWTFDRKTGAEIDEGLGHHRKGQVAT
jgi:hypothetical protein